MAENILFKATYIGGPTVILEIGGLRLITDPTLDPAGSVYHLGNLTVEKTNGPATLAIGQIDMVLLSHDQHFDNLDIAGRQLVQTVPRTYTTEAGATRLSGTSIGLVPWQSDTVVTPDGTVLEITATPARHGPAGTETIQGNVIGFVLSIKGEQGADIYLTGDTVYYEGIADVADRFRPAYIFIFAGAAQTRGPFNVTMGTNDAMDTALAFPDATIIPLHYEGWKHYTQNEKDVQQSFQVIGIDQRLTILEPGVATVFA